MKQKELVKRLLALVIIFCLVFSQTLVWVNFSYAQETDEVQPSSQSTPTPTANPEPAADSQTAESPPVEKASDPSNENTGPSSGNVDSWGKLSKVSIFNANKIWLENRIDSVVNTGWNQANYNTGDGVVVTGNAYARTDLQAQANTNSTVIPDSLGENSLISVAAQNEKTGPESSNLAEAEILKEVEIVNKNELDNVNEIGVLSNTGGNEAMCNTGSGIIKSGDAQAAVDLVINANSNFINSGNSVMGSFSFFGENTGDLDFSNFGQTSVFEVDEGGVDNGFVEESLTYFKTDSGVLASNTTTGPDSENYTVLEATSSAELINDNYAVVENNVLVAATTGNNTASYNTGSGLIESGDADLIANVVNFINSNIVDAEVILATINVFGQWIGDLILPALGLEENSYKEATITVSNKDTGSNSNNQATTEIDSDLEVMNENNNLIINNFNPKANTGENRAEYNTSGGMIETGEVSAQSSLASVANTNITNSNPILLIINTLGEWVGAIISPDGTVTHQSGEQDVVVYSTFGDESVNFADGPVTLTESFNQETGPNSENITKTNIDQETLIKNTNDLVIENNIDLLADTGGNEASYNTGQGMIKSGDANLIANLVNFVNTNITGGKVIIAVINVFGEWFGNIISPNNLKDDSGNQDTNTGTGGSDFDSVVDVPNQSNDSSGDSSGDTNNDDNQGEISDNQTDSLTSQNDSSYEGTPPKDNSSNDFPPDDSDNEEEQNIFGFLVDNSGSGSDFSGGIFSGGSETDSSPDSIPLTLKAKLFFDPYGFYTSLGNFLEASPRVVKMIGEGRVGSLINFIPQLTLLTLLITMVTGVANFLKKTSIRLEI